VDTAFGINELGDVDVAGYGDKGVGVIAGEMGAGKLLGEEDDHVANGHLGRSLEVFVEAHGDVLGGGFGAGPDEAVGIVEAAFMHDELKGSGELGFEGCDVDFAVALVGVTVACFKERALSVDRIEDSSASDEFLVVHVAAVHPWWGGVVATGGFGWGDADAAEERVEGDLDAGSEAADHLFAVERDDPRFAVRKVVGQETAADAERVAGPWDVDVDLQDADFEDVARLGFFDRDRAGEDVSAGAFIGCGDFRVDVGDVGRNVCFGDAEGFEALGGAAGGEGLDFDGVAGLDGEDWLGAGGIVSPGYGGGSGEESLCGLLRECRGEGEDDSGAEGGCAGEVGGHGLLYITEVREKRGMADSVRD
jgi:hypothetical protein